MPSVNEELRRTLASARGRTSENPLAFAYFSGGDGALLIGSSARDSKIVAEARKETKGSSPVTGECFGDEGTMVFETPGDPPGALARGIKSCAKAAGMTLNVVTRKKGAGEEEAEESESQESSQSTKPSTSPKPAPAAKPDKARVDRIGARVRDITTRAGTGPTAAAVKAKITAAAVAFRSAHLDEAETLLDEAEEML